MPERIVKRKHHTKSRKGCHQCKQRHTKCNEAHPRCANCIRLDIACTWPSVQNGSSNPESHVSMAMEHRNFSSPDLLSGVTTLPLDDMRLLHHWCTKTATSMNKNLPTKRIRMWQETIVELAFDFPFLLHGLLGLASLHKAASDARADLKKLLVEADSHISSALATYRKNLEEPSLQAAVPMFLLSSLLVTYNLAGAQLDEPDDPIACIDHCFRLLAGVKFVIHPFWNQLKDTEIFNLMADTAMSSQIDPKPQDNNIGEILRLKDLVMDLEPVEKESCAKAIDELNKTFIRASKCSPDENEHSVMMVWPAVLTDEFLNMISLQKPIAVLILSHWAVLMARTRNSWWIKGWPLRIISASQRLLEDDMQFRTFLEWPLEQCTTSVAGA